MKTHGKILGAPVLIIIAMLAMPTGIWAQDSEFESNSASGFTHEELMQMLAPIALYPDSLIAQVLMASTYPLEVVEAERWVRRNAELKNDALDNALQEKTWDDSVKSLCHFPDVLFAMSDKLDQTRKLGDAYLAQEDDVMAAIQALRKKAAEQGNLKSTKEQTVTGEADYIRIEPADPRVVYVPVYNPLYVYGPWWYPAYPPWHWYYPTHVIVSGGHIVFTPGFYIGLGIFSWCWFDWHAHHIYVDYSRAPRFHRHHWGFDPGRRYWRHNPAHRRGVAYRDRATSARFGRQRPGSASWDRERRGYPERTDMRSGEPSRRLPREQVRKSEPRRSTERETVRPGTTGRTYHQRPGEPSGKSSGVQTRKSEPSKSTQRESASGGTRRETSFGGIGNGNFEYRAGQRGAESRRSTPQSFQSPHTGRPMSTGGGSFQRDGNRGGGYHR